MLLNDCMLDFRKWISGRGNKERIRTLTVLSVSQIVSWGSTYYSFSLFVEPIHQENGWTHNQITGALTLGLMAWALSAPVISRWLEKGLGRRVMTTGSLIASAGFLLWALFPDQLPLFYLSWLIIGLCMSMSLYTSAFTILAKQFPDSYKQSIATLTLVGGFASTLFIPLIQYSIDYTGWQNSIYLLALTNLCISPLYYFGVDESNKISSGIREKSKLIDFSLFKHIHFNSRYFWGLLTWFVGYSATSSSITFLMIPVLSAMDIRVSVIIFAMALIGPMQVAGRFLYLIVSTRISIATSSLYLGVLLIGATSLLIAVPMYAVTLITFVVLFGIAKGIMTIIMGTSVMELLGSDVYARTNGWLSSGATFANALTPLAFGMIWHQTGDPQSVLLACWAASLLVIPGIYLIRKESNKMVIQNSTNQPD